MSTNCNSTESTGTSSSPLFRAVHKLIRKISRFSAFAMTMNKNQIPCAYLRHNNIALHRYKAIYFFIPKVACTSLKKVCADLLDMKIQKRVGIYKEDIHWQNYPYVPKSEIMPRYKDYFKFCFVRNPWDRLASCYRDKVANNENYDHPMYKKGVFREFLKYPGIRSRMTFEEFVSIIQDIPDREADSHFCSQHTFITDEKGRLLVDYIGRLESLSEDILYVSKRLWLSDIMLPHLMTSSNHKHYREYYTETTKQIVRRRFEKDIEMFGYEF